MAVRVVLGGKQVGDTMTTTWRDAQGVLAPYLPDLPAEVILRRQRDGLCIYCGQSWCAGCKTTVLEPTPALRAEDV